MQEAENGDVYDDGIDNTMVTAVVALEDSMEITSTEAAAPDTAVVVKRERLMSIDTPTQQSDNRV